MKRVLLKISGEAFSWEWEKWINPERVREIAKMIATLYQKWYELIIVFGWWNVYRGSMLIESWVNPTDSHNLWMLSSVFNAVVLKNFLEEISITSDIYDALWIEFLNRYQSNQARRSLERGNIVLSTSGIGNPYFSTDTAWVLRALELWAEAMIKLTKVDGVYDSDPKKNPEAQKFDSLSYDDILTRDLKILDQTWVILARDNGLPLYVTKMGDESTLMSILEWNKGGTKIS